MTFWQLHIHKKVNFRRNTTLDLNSSTHVVNLKWNISDAIVTNAFSVNKAKIMFNIPTLNRKIGYVSPVFFLVLFCFFVCFFGLSFVDFFLTILNLRRWKEGQKYLCWHKSHLKLTAFRSSYTQINFLVILIKGKNSKGGLPIPGCLRLKFQLS